MYNITKTKMKQEIQGFFQSFRKTNINLFIEDHVMMLNVPLKKQFKKTNGEVQEV